MLTGVPGVKGMWSLKVVQCSKKMGLRMKLERSLDEVRPILDVISSHLYWRALLPPAVEFGVGDGVGGAILI